MYDCYGMTREALVPAESPIGSVGGGVEVICSASIARLCRLNVGRMWCRGRISR